MKILTVFKGYWHRFINKYLPTRLPVGMEQLDIFCEKALSIYNIPDLPSYRHAIAAMIMHMGPTIDRVTLYHIARSIRKAQSNQVCYELIQRLKEDEKAANAEPIQV